MAKMAFKTVMIFKCCVILLLTTISCQERKDDIPKEQSSTLRLATTTSVVQSGLLDDLLPVFKKKYNIGVDISAKGSGLALQLAREGKADVVLVHSRDAEDKFVSDGYGVNRMDVMYNDFIILGPSSDPAQIKGEKDVLIAFRKIFDKKALFISRGDNSGTNIRELELWKLLGVHPEGDWYKKVNKGMLETLNIAIEQEAYVLCDRSTFIHNRKELKLEILVEGDQLLYNPYGIIAVNPAQVSGVNFKAAMEFIDFLISVDGQAIIEDYGRVKFGRSLFTPLVIK